MTELIRPFDNSYWVIPDQLLAGEYPGSPSIGEAYQRVGRLVALGVTYFLDLTTPADLLLPYAAYIRPDPSVSGLAPVRVNFPIRDFDIPTREDMKRILDALDAALAGGQTVYLHCWGGSGRTGTVAGCYLVRHGMTGEQALLEITRKRAVIPPEMRRPSPETEAQRKMVRNWLPGA